MAEGERQICRFWAQGGCRFDARHCRYSHNQAGGYVAVPAHRNARENIDTFHANLGGEGKLRQLKKLLKQVTPGMRPLDANVDLFFELGRQLLDGDVGGTQETITLLANENGLSYVKELVDRQAIHAIQGVQNRVATWTRVRNLFAIATHPAVMDSSVLEQKVATLYNFLFGVGGERMARLFDFVTTVLASWPHLDIRGKRISAVEISLALLTKLLECNTSNVVDPKFPHFANQLAVYLEEATEEDAYSKFQGKKHLDYIQRRLAVGQYILPHQSGVEKGIPVFRETLAWGRDLPGTLSPEGKRHDNDSADITAIKILPTYEEIVSPRAEYLPTNNPDNWHIAGIRGRLDREFRLLREDTVGQLRDAVRDVLERLRAPRESDKKKNPVQNGLRTYSYDGATATAVNFNRHGDLEFVVRCKQHPSVRSLKLQKRREWWLQSKRLQEGALVCVLNAAGSILYFVVSKSTCRVGKPNPKDQDANEGADKESGQAGTSSASLADDSDHICVVLNLVHPVRSNLRGALEWYQKLKASPKSCLVEFPGVLLCSFIHTLESLQQIYRSPDIPFINLIAPDAEAMTGAEVTLNPPKYATKADFVFDLGAIVTDGLPCQLSTEQNLTISPDTLSARTELDQTQARSLLDTLSRELAIIQGPPGTGKSFTGEKIIQTFIANSKKAKLGPVLCVCYTNHALDQLLEHLLDVGIEKMIRIGSQSKSDRLKSLNLRIVGRGSELTKTEKRDHWLARDNLASKLKEGQEDANDFATVQSWQRLKIFLREHHPERCLELFGTVYDTEGYRSVKHREDRVLRNWLAKGAKDTATPMRPLMNVPLLEMTHQERAQTHRGWLREISEVIIGHLVDDVAQINVIRESKSRIRQEVDLRCLRQTQVIGITTTGLAQNLKLLHKLRCKTLVCEEAAELMESHLLTALLPSIEHAVLIGDHLQLRPQTQNFELQSTNPRGAKHSLDVSLFERLVQPANANEIRLPFSTLETQRRMHPSIAELISSTLYPNLTTAANVSLYPPVLGLKKRLFWFDHRNAEAGASGQDPHSTSHVNKFEVDFTVALVGHIAKQSAYKDGEIAVLTPYLGQLHCLRHRLQDIACICLNDRDAHDLEALEEQEVEANGATGATFSQRPTVRVTAVQTTLLKKVRVATVDNFQGEEAKIVIVSLVRSNPQNRCGFLSTRNRINVLLSRAQHGMFLIGDSNTYAHVAMWRDVIQILKRDGNFGTELELQCPRHPDTRICVSTADHFVQFAPESGCLLKCDKRLGCGHSCTGLCHADVIHNTVVCSEPCPRPKAGCDHVCPRLCGYTCEDRCNVKLENICLRLSCGHAVSSALCWETQDPTKIQCKVLVKRQVPGCQHEIHLACYVDVQAEQYRCMVECAEVLSCGHSCKNMCSECRTRINGAVEVHHGRCKQICNRNFQLCQHACADPCHDEDKKPCRPCSLRCEVACSHSRCPNKCHEPCVPCAEQRCESRCKHSQCSMPCAAPCDWVPCSKRCAEKLACGHQCPSLCGEVCPSAEFCQDCGSDDIKATIVDLVMLEPYSNINLNENPCIFLPCGHFLAATTFDGQMDMAAHYEMDAASGFPVALKASSQPFSMKEAKGCSTCRASLRSVNRCGRIVRRALLDEATKKFVTWSHMQHLALADQILDMQQRLSETTCSNKAPTLSDKQKSRLHANPIEQYKQLSKELGEKRYAEAIKLRKNLSNYAKQVHRKEQPFLRVANFVKFANQHKLTRGHFSFDESQVQVKGFLQAVSLQLNCDTVVLSDFLEQTTNRRTQACQISYTSNFAGQLKDAEFLANSAKEASLPLLEAEGHLHYAQFCVIAKSFVSGEPDGGESAQSPENPNGAKTRSDFNNDGLEHVANVRRILRRCPQDIYPSAASLTLRAEDIERTLKNGVFYHPVSVIEMRAVYAAMAREFSGTGHWYTCEQGHPFTVGECGMPMELARCPECQSAVGGQNHHPATGVQHASDIDALANAFEGL